MKSEEDTRPKILLSELILIVRKLCKECRITYVPKIESVVTALASLESGKMGEIEKRIKELHLFIGAAAYDEVKSILRLLQEKDIVEKQGKIYRLTYVVIPHPHLKNLKNHSSKDTRYISDLLDRVIRLRLANFTLKEPELALASISLLTELRVYLGNLKSVVTKQSAIRITEAVQKIDEYQTILGSYRREGEMPETEGRTFFELEATLTDLYSPQFDSALRNKNPGYYPIGKLDGVSESLLGVVDG
jgi:hypothetical protein